MLLIRGFDQEQYARQIRGATIGFRDLLTTLMYHERNGYKLSDYYEECLIRAIDQSSMEGIRFDGLPRKTREQLKLIFDSFVPYFYLSYFHVFNENSLKWLERNFSEDSHFIFAVPRLQQLEGMDEMMYGPHMIGSRMIYLPPEGQARTAMRLIQKSGMVTLQQAELDASVPYGGTPMDAAMYMTNMMTVICLEALARRCSGDYNADENEFRIIYKIPTPYRREIDCFRAEEPRVFNVSVDGMTYQGRVTHHLTDIPGGFRRGYNMRLTTESPLVSTPATSLGEALDAGRRFTIRPHFLPVDVRPCFREYGYIGNKAQCRAFIEEKLKAADH